MNSVTDVFIMFSIMFLVGFIYIKKELMYINPVLLFWGYEIYNVTIYEKSSLNSDKIEMDRIAILHSSENANRGATIKGTIGDTLLVTSYGIEGKKHD